MCLVLTKDKIGKIFENAEKAQAFIKKYTNISVNELVKDRELFCAYLYCFVVYSQAVLTLANYIIVKKKLELPRNFQESLSILIDNDIIPDHLEPQAKLMVELRNLILHSEAEVSSDNVKAIIEGLPHFEEIYIAVKEEVNKILAEL